MGLTGWVSRSLLGGWVGVPVVKVGRSPRACCACELGLVVKFGTPWIEQVRMQAEMPSDPVEVTLEILGSSGEKGEMPEEHLCQNQPMPDRKTAIAENHTCPSPSGRKHQETIWNSDPQPHFQQFWFHMCRIGLRICFKKLSGWFWYRWSVNCPAPWINAELSLRVL